ncbi:unnamed protein product [Pleuronectes platessa]|uniref:Uncharacterized protein n=1 Tax=Pleuronectes platessa TaxID=8262 RepID=A0A9N7Y8L7_PLEPL|nr:unnamed protein product [Pleuronectes platessa]
MDGLSGNEKQELKAGRSRARMGRDEQHERRHNGLTVWQSTSSTVPDKSYLSGGRQREGGRQRRLLLVSILGRNNTALTTISFPGTSNPLYAALPKEKSLEHRTDSWLSLLKKIHKDSIKLGMRLSYHI